MKKVLLSTVIVLGSVIALSVSAQSKNATSPFSQNTMAIGDKQNTGSADLNGDKQNTGSADLNKQNTGSADLNGEKQNTGSADLN